MAKTPHANRGKSFEKLIDETNKSYQFQNLGLIQKIPNEWTIVRERTADCICFFSG